MARPRRAKAEPWEPAPFDEAAGPPSPPPPPPPAPSRNDFDNPTAALRIVGKRVDALGIAFESERAARLVAACLPPDAGTTGRARRGVLRRPGLTAEVRGQRAEGRFTVANGDLRGVVDGRAEGGFTIELHALATMLATTPIADAVAMLCRAAEALGWRDSGEVDERGRPRSYRLRRLDLCADIAGWNLSGMQSDDGEPIALADTVVSKASTTTFCPEAEVDPALRIYRRDLDVNAVYIGAGNCVMARIYDKGLELSLPGQEQKRDIERRVWRNNGWRDGEPVGRVEFQLKSEALDDFNLRDPAGVDDRLDGLWSYLTGGRSAPGSGEKRRTTWLRLVDPTTATRRQRAKLLPVWELVQRVVFKHQFAAPADRSRVRIGGATAAQALGTLMSFVSGGRGGFEEVDLPNCENATAEDEVAARRRLKRLVVNTLRTAVDPIVEELGGQYAGVAQKASYSRALMHVAIKRNGSIARYRRAADADAVGAPDAADGQDNLPTRGREVPEEHAA